MMYVLPRDLHDRIVDAAFRARGYAGDEAASMVKLCAAAARHGVKTHNALKAIGLQDNLGRAGGCAPGAKIEVLPSKYKAVQRWNANRKPGPAVAFAAMETCEKLADEFGIGAVAVDNAFHYLWGGGYVIDSADRGYIAYTCCTAGRAEVVPHGGKSPTVGTNPHSWGFPTRDIIGFSICVDFAASVVALGRAQQFAREGKMLPEGCALDKDGKPTCDPSKIAALLPMGGHKGFGLAIVDELIGAYIGGSLPTLRSRWKEGPGEEKHTPSFFFQCIRPDAIRGDDFAMKRSQSENVRAVLADIKAHGNDSCLFPGEPESRAAAISDRRNGLLFTAAEIEAFAKLAGEGNISFETSKLAKVADD
jgi:L-2-hydroxycarboxylate dehydrogenase (NAD+)